MFDKRISINDPFLNVAYRAVCKAERVILRDFAESAHLTTAEDRGRDFIKKTELRVAEVISEVLLEAYPYFGCYIEDKGWLCGRNEDYWWLIDPIDGTSNFIHNIPHFAVNIALMFRGEVALALTFDPIKDNLFYACKGKGVFLNNKRLRKTKSRKLEDSLLLINNLPTVLQDKVENKKNAKYEKMIEGGANKKTAKVLEALCLAIKELQENISSKTLDAWYRKGARRRNFGAASLDLAYLASGKADFYYGNVLRTWDIAPGLLFLKEADMVSCVWEVHHELEKPYLLRNGIKTHYPDSWHVLIAHNDVVPEFKEVWIK